MADDIDVLRRGYEAFGRGDIDAIAQDFTDDIEFIGPDSRAARQYQGKAAVAGLLAAMGERWDGLTWAPEEFIHEGGTVVVLGHMSGTARGSGTQVSIPFAHVWRVSGGKVRHGRAFTDTAAIGAALGG